MDWDRFAFDYRYELDGLIPCLIRVEANKEAALSLVLPPEWRDQLDKSNRVRAVYGTTALEGNPLSEAEVSKQIEILDKQGNEAFHAPKLSREQIQILNSDSAQTWVRQRFQPGSAPLQVRDILEMHRIVTNRSDTTNNVPGRFRTFPVTVGSPDAGGVHKGAPHERVESLMEGFIEFINSRKMLESEHPVTRALLAHFFLVTIHPF